MTGELNWLLDDLVDRVPAVHQALLLSRDGLVMANSRGLAAKDAQFLAALSSGFHSLARGAAEHYAADRINQAVIELDDRLFFVLPAGTGTCLAVLSDSGPQAAQVAYEMAVLIERVSRHLTAAARTGT
ncbi:roadblock/LC7 domain-containing protein [Actinocorallia sp. API 0066]|uniref:roadblock/LC7 domain-containing protein n=1 Tax=Actinocorallia sp. API 0066 TaxID=2896846 RepID=UPI001E62BFDC|nr:roadblock/LC7 domain-containing protein [Actinocorallia sp. API 0066]MCD0449126.1 roadblock/LC7 domain-containing protein [Actinocorallia sp. API 0066]